MILPNYKYAIILVTVRLQKTSSRNLRVISKYFCPKSEPNNPRENAQITNRVATV